MTVWDSTPIAISRRRSLTDGRNTVDGQGEIASLRAKETADHNAEAPDLARVQRIDILLEFAAVSGIEGVPGDEDGLVTSFVRRVLGRQLEIAFPGDGGLFALIGRVGWG